MYMYILIYTASYFLMYVFLLFTKKLVMPDTRALVNSFPVEENTCFLHTSGLIQILSDRQHTVTYAVQLLFSHESFV